MANSQTYVRRSGDLVPGTIWDTRVRNEVWNTDSLSWESQSISNSGSLVDLRRGQTILFSSVSASSSGDNAVVAADATKKIKILHYTLVADAAVAVKWKSGAGTDLTGAMSFAANGGTSSPAASPAAGWLFETAVNEALNLNLGGAVGVRGHISYFLEA